MPQKISISRWNLGESSLKSIGDYSENLYNTSCRFLRNFVISETGKIYRRPGFEHHVVITHEDVRIVTYYLPDDTLVLVFFLTGTFPNQTLEFDWYILEDVGLPKKKFVFKYNHKLLNSFGTTFESGDFEKGRPKTVNLKKLSYVQVDNHIYLTHPNMQDPWDLEFDYVSFDFIPNNFSTSNRSYYWDVWFDNSTTPGRWVKDAQPDFNLGGGISVPGGTPTPNGWMPYTGLTPDSSEPNQGKTVEAPIQSFKYLSGVSFYMERLVWVVGPRVHGSMGGDPLACGFQYNTSIPATIDQDPFVVLAADPFLYRASSDLGYEDFKWIASGPLLMAGANNGAWVLSNPQTGGIDTTNPLMYKATSNGAHWVPGKTIGDALLYFQRPGRQLNEFLFSNTSQNYIATNLSEYADHIFFEYTPIEMQVQRSPFNIAMIVREDGQLVSFTYDRQRQITAWAQHPFDKGDNPNVTDDDSKVLSIGIYSDGNIDSVVAVTKRWNSNGSYQALELMDEYTPDDVNGIFSDAAETQKLEGDYEVLNIVEDATNGHWIYYDSSVGDFADGQILQFPGASRTDDPVNTSNDSTKDYIFGEWEVFDIDLALHRCRIMDMTGAPYIGIFTLGDTAYSYLSYGSARRVIKHPTDTRFAHLSGISCRALLDGTPYSIYVNKAGTKFYNAATIPEDWDGNESTLAENIIFWNSIIIGRPYTSIFSPLVLKKQINKGKINKIELEVFRSLGGKVGIGHVSLDNNLTINKTAELIYPVSYNENQLYTGTIKPQIVGGYEDDPLWFIGIDDAVPFNLTNIIYHLGAN